MSDIKKPENQKVISKTWDYITNNFLIIFFFSIFISIILHFYGKLELTIYDNGSLSEVLFIFCLSLLVYIIPFAICAVKIHRNILLNEDLVGEIINSFVLIKSLKYSLWAYIIMILCYLPTVILFFLFFWSGDENLVYLLLLLISFIVGMYAVYRLSFYLPYLVTTNENKPMSFFSSFHKDTKGLVWTAFLSVVVYCLFFIILQVIIDVLIIKRLLGFYDINIIREIIINFWTLTIVVIISFTYKSKYVR